MPIRTRRLSFLSYLLETDINAIDSGLGMYLENLQAIMKYMTLEDEQNPFHIAADELQTKALTGLNRNLPLPRVARGLATLGCFGVTPSA